MPPKRPSSETGTDQKPTCTFSDASLPLDPHHRLRSTTHPPISLTMDSGSEFAERHYGFAALLVVIGILNVVGGVSEGVYITAAGLILGILLRAAAVSSRPE